MALSTGVPEIQAAAIADMMILSERLHHTGEPSDELSGSEFKIKKVNWTPGLVKVFGTIVAPFFDILGLTDISVFGYLRISFPGGVNELYFHYIEGFCLSRFGGEEQVNRDEEVEATFVRCYGKSISDAIRLGNDNINFISSLIYGGYTHPFFNLSQTDGDKFSHTITLSAIRSVRYQLLRYAQNYFNSVALIAPSPYIHRIRKMLETMNPFSFLPPYLITYYRISLGERVDIRGDDPDGIDEFNSSLYSVGIPPFEQPTEDLLSDQKISGRILYDSAGVLAENWNEDDIAPYHVLLESDSFRLGRGTGRALGSTPYSVNREPVNKERVLPYIRHRDEYNHAVAVGQLTGFEMSTLEITIGRIRGLQERIFSILKGASP